MHARLFRPALLTTLALALAACGQQAPTPSAPAPDSKNGPVQSTPEPAKSLELRRVLEVRDTRENTAFTKVVADTLGNVYVGGNIATNRNEGATYNAFVSKYTADGTLVWSKTFGGEDAQDVAGLVLGADGFLYANISSRLPDNSFPTTLYKLDAQGNVAQQKAIPSARSEYAVDAQGKVFVPTGNNTDSAPQVEVYGADFNLTRTITFGSGRSGIARFVRQDAQGNLFVSGFFQQYIPDPSSRGFPDCPSESFVARLSPDPLGSPEWLRTFKDEQLPRSEVNDLAVGDAGRLFMVWNAYDIDCNGDRQRTALKRYDADGTWRYNKNIPETLEVGIAGTVGDVVYVTDSYFNTSFTKYDGVNGEALSTFELPLPEGVQSNGSDSVVTPDGSLYFAAKQGNVGYWARFKEE